MQVSPLLSSYAVAGSTTAPTAKSSQTTSNAKTQDVVKLSGAALAKSFEMQGMTASEIAVMLGVDLATVDGYLGITPSKTAATYGSNANASGTA